MPPRNPQKIPLARPNGMYPESISPVIQSHLLALLTEYADKLQDYAKSERLNLGNNTNAAKTLVAKLTDLASFASQLIEYASLEPLEKSEMAVRLAEFEMMLQVCKTKWGV